MEFLTWLLKSVTDEASQFGLINRLLENYAGQCSWNYLSKAFLTARLLVKQHDLTKVRAEFKSRIGALLILG